MHLSTHHAQKTTKKTVSLCTLAAHFFSTPKARMMGTGILSRSPPMSKFCSDLCVCAPHSLLETEHNSQKNHRINHIILAAGATRDKLDRADKAAIYGVEG